MNIDMKEGVSIAEIKKMLADADEDQIAEIERALGEDPRKGIHDAIASARRRAARKQAEIERVEQLYRYQNDIARVRECPVFVGLDEVGRGPLAGPLAVGAVVLPNAPKIMGLNDSKKLSYEKRIELAEQIKETAIAWTVCYVQPEQIDEMGMTRSLKTAFAEAVSRIEDGSGIALDMILLDGNPLHLDSREVNIIKGDAKCASISAASIIAKVDRDLLMEEYDEQYPGYGFSSNRGYGSADHIEEIRRRGLSPIHRRSFCKNFM